MAINFNYIMKYKTFFPHCIIIDNNTRCYSDRNIFYQLKLIVYLGYHNLLNIFNH